VCLLAGKGVVLGEDPSTRLLCVLRVLNPVLCLTPVNCGTTFALFPYCQSGTSEIKIGVSYVPKNDRYGIVMYPFCMHVPGWHITRNAG
jgi:hypothetical protein